MTLQIGLTGGIGSGKTTVAKALIAEGYRIYFADDRAKALYMEDLELKDAMVDLLGPSIYEETGELDRKKLGAIIFQDKEILAKVNALVHPAVARDYARWLVSTPASYTRKVVLKEAAILFEARTDTGLDGVLMVYAPLNLRLQRVAARDQASSEAIIARMRNQWPDARKIQRSDFIIFNDGLHPLEPQVASAIQWMEGL